MLRRKTSWFIASLTGLLVALCVTPFSFAFLAAALVWGVLLAALMFTVRTRRDKWLPDLAFGLVAIVGMRVTMELVFPGVRSDSLRGLALALLYCCIVGLVYFGYEWNYTQRRLRRGYRGQAPTL
jgi:hypothetical protein